MFAFILGLLLGAAIAICLVAFIDGEDSASRDEWDDWRHYYD